jgi:hypothetical protein
MPAQPSGPTSDGRDAGPQRHDGARVGLDELGEPARGEDPGEDVVGAVHVVARAAEVAVAARHQRVQQHRVADGNVRDRRSRPRAPSPPSRGRHERQADARALPGLVELAVPDVDVGAAEARRPDPDDHVGRVR